MVTATGVLSNTTFDHEAPGDRAPDSMLEQKGADVYFADIYYHTDCILLTGINCCQISVLWHNNRLELLLLFLHKQMCSPDRPTVTKIGAGNSLHHIPTTDVPAFVITEGWILRTLCRLTVGGFGFIRGHGGPREGLRANTVHILKKNQTNTNTHTQENKQDKFRVQISKY